jgi:hypothetical protein
MSNPLNNEKAVYQKIIKEKLIIPSIIWQLLDHHLRNDLNVISLIVGYYIAGNAQESIPPTEGKKIIERCEEISRFLKKLKDATDK